MNLLVAVPTFAATLAWLTFVVWYWIRAKWWKIPVGRNTMGTALVLFFILLRSSLIHLFPGLKEYPAAGTVVYILASAIAIQRTIYMERAQRELDKTP